MMIPKNSHPRCLKPFLVFLTTVVIHLLILPVYAQLPVLVSDPADGGLFSEDLIITFFQPMEDDIAIEFEGTGGITFDCAWQGGAFPGIPKLIFRCLPNGILPPGSVVTWTINPDGTGFTTIAGDVLPTTSGTFIVPGDSIGGGGGNGGGGNGSTPAPECPVDATSLPFPKTVSVCGTELFPWDSAAVIPLVDGSGYVLSAFMGSDDGSIDSIARLDVNGDIVSKAMALDTDTELGWTPDANFVAAHRVTPAGDELTVGLYNATDGFASIYEKTLALTANNVDISELSDGQISLVQDLSTQIDVILLSPVGDVSWAQQYSSPVFGLDSLPGDFPDPLPPGGFPNFGPSQQVSFDQMPEGYLLTVIKTEQALVGLNLDTSHTITLIRLDAFGAVLWAKTYTGLDTFSVPDVSITRDGSLFLKVFDTQIDDPLNPDPELSSILIHLGANGNFLWGKRFSDITIGALSSLPDGTFFFSGSLTDPDSLLTQSVFATFDSNGNISHQVLASAGESTFGFALPEDNRLWYTLLTGDLSTGIEANDPVQDTVIGSSSFALDDWQWQQYTRPISTASLLPKFNNTDLVFSAFHRDNHTLDLIKLDDNLTADAPCELFVPVDVGVTALSLTPSVVSVQVANATVNVTSITPDFTPGSISLGTFSCAEGSICENGLIGD